MIRQSLTFDDVLLVPQYSPIRSRSDVDISVDLGKGIKLDIPIISANMSHVTGRDMCVALSALGGLPIMHRFYPTLLEQVEAFKEVKDIAGKDSNIGVSVGVGKTGEYTVNALLEAGANIICLDIAHCDSVMGLEMVSYIATRTSGALLIAGNVATAIGARRLIESGANVVKVGIGGSMVCTTRTQAGAGVPQLTALIDVYDYCKNHKVKFISDGGHRQPSDLVKALCFSHAVMLGGMLAGAEEAPGEIIFKGNQMYKEYSGSSTHKPGHIEGVRAMVPFKGPVKNVIRNITDGIKSGCSYQGVNNLIDLKSSPEFVQITNAGIVESRPHDVIIL